MPVWLGCLHSDDGYATVIQDFRGRYDSQGKDLPFFESGWGEHRDGLDTLTWIAAQPWCDGNIGTQGASAMGITQILTAAAGAPLVKAQYIGVSTASVYHSAAYPGGGLGLALIMGWLTEQDFNSDNVWLTALHPFYDSHWRLLDAEPRTPAVEQPGVFFGGWYDIFQQGTIDAFLDRQVHGGMGARGHQKLIIGPWAHRYPEQGVPEPAIGFLQECLRWWDYWLKGIETGIMDEPMLRVWLQESVEPRTFYAVRPGRWIAEPAWPSPHITSQTFTLNGAGTLTSPLPPLERRGSEGEVRLDLLGAQACGLEAGVWCPYGSQAEMPGDQRTEDSLSLCFTSAPLEAPMEILGFPEVGLTVAVDRPNALLAVRLCDVAPTGASTLVSWGLLNLTHRDPYGHEQPRPLEPGQRYSVTLRLNVITHSLPVGHRWRVAVSPTYWPHAWPSPEPVTLSLFTGEEENDGGWLKLPVRAPRVEDANLTPFEPPESTAPLAVETLSTGSRSRVIRRDVVQGLFQIIDHGERGAQRLIASGVEYERSNSDTFTLIEGDPLSASVQCDLTIKISRGDWRTRVETSSLMSADAETFRVTNVLNAYEGNTRVFNKTWTFTVPRDMV
jgi:hypothetical protein